MKHFYSFIAIIGFVIVNAQTDTTNANWRLYPKKDAAPNSLALADTSKTLDTNAVDGVLTVVGDDKIKAMNTQLAADNFFYGYTVQLEVSQRQDVIRNAKFLMLKVSPGIDFEEPYIEPNLYLYAGRFYDRASAYAYKNQISEHFPSAIVIGPKKMPLPTINN